MASSSSSESKKLNPKASEFHPLMKPPLDTQQTLDISSSMASVQKPCFSLAHRIFLPYGESQGTIQTVPFQYYLGSEAVTTPAVIYYYNGFSMFPYGYCHQQSVEPAMTLDEDGEMASQGRENFRALRSLKSFTGFIPPKSMRRDFRQKTRNVCALEKNKTSVYDESDDVELGHFEALLSWNTSIMIKNVPNRIQRQDLLRTLDDHCREENIKARRASDSRRSAYDFLYLPMDFSKHANLGYAFVNFTSSIAAVKFCRAFDKHKWNIPGNRKICEVTLAKFQGKDELSRHFSNSRFTCHTDNYLPVVISPPSDGFVRYRFSVLGERTGGRRAPCKRRSVPSSL